MDFRRQVDFNASLFAFFDPVEDCLVVFVIEREVFVGLVPTFTLFHFEGQTVPFFRVNPGCNAVANFVKSVHEFVRPGPNVNTNGLASGDFFF